MAESSYICAMKVSEHFFRLTTEAVRIFSNETYTYESLNSLIDVRAGRANLLDHGTETLRSHLEAIPVDGAIPITIDIAQTSADMLMQAAALVAKQLLTRVRFEEALSILFFDYIVEHKALMVLERLRLGDATDGNTIGEFPNSLGENVIRIK